MGAALSLQVQAFLKGKVLAHLATVMPDGSPQITPVWVDTDGTYVIVNTSEGRAKLNNIRRDPRVAVSVFDSANFYRGVVVKGKVAKVTTNGAEQHIHSLAKKYMGADRYPLQPGETRVMVFIDPSSVTARGLD